MKLVSSNWHYKHFESVPLREIEELSKIKNLRLHRASITTYVLLDTQDRAVMVYNLSGSLTQLNFNKELA